MVFQGVQTSPHFLKKVQQDGVSGCLSKLGAQSCRVWEGETIAKDAAGQRQKSTREKKKKQFNLILIVLDFQVAGNIGLINPLIFNHFGYGTYAQVTKYHFLLTKLLFAWHPSWGIFLRLTWQNFAVILGFLFFFLISAPILGFLFFFLISAAIIGDHISASLD